MRWYIAWDEVLFQYTMLNDNDSRDKFDACREVYDGTELEVKAVLRVLLKETEFQGDRLTRAMDFSIRQHRGR